MYPPSMLSSAALAAAATRLEEQQLHNESIEQLDNRQHQSSRPEQLDNRLQINRSNLLKQLQIFTGVELVRI